MTRTTFPARIILGLILVVVMAFAPAMTSSANAADNTSDQPQLVADKTSYLPGETISLTGTHFAPGETVTVFISADPSKGGLSLQGVADDSGSVSLSGTMPEADADSVALADPDLPSRESGPSFTATATGETSGSSAQVQFTAGHEATDAERMITSESYWNHRLTYPTGRFNPKWVRNAAQQNRGIRKGYPSGRRRQFGLHTTQDSSGGTQTQSVTLNSASGGVYDPSLLNTTSTGFIALGPKPERMTGCSGCYDYGTTSGRTNDIVIDPTTTTNGSIVAYAGTVGGGVWKTTNCCSSSTTWDVVTDDPLIATTAIDSLTIDPSNHNTIYAGTGDLNYGSFSMGSQGILKSTDAGATWSVLGAEIFGPSYSEPAGQFPQYDAVGKVRVDPNNSNKVMAGTKKGIFVSYDAGVNWTGPCTVAYPGQRQDITGLELTNLGSGNTRIIAAVGVRGFATTVQYDLGNNGANGLYKASMPDSGCPSFTAISGNSNGFVFGTAVTGSPYATGANLNAASGTPYSNVTTGNQVGRIDIAVAPSNPNVIYAQVQSIAANNNSGCGNTNGCQLGAFASTDGGTTWSFMAGSQGGALRACGSNGTQGTTNGSAGGGDYPQNWYDQGVAVDPNNPDRVMFNTFDTWIATRTGTDWYNITCGYAGTSVANHVTHVDHHAQAFVPGSSSILLIGDDGGIHGTTNAGTVASGSTRPTWFNMDGGFNTIEFYSGDISGNFFTSTAPMAAGGAQDNGPSSVTFSGTPTGAVQWQMGLGGDGFSGRIDPIGTGTSLRVWEGNNSGGLSRCISNCSNSGASWSSKRGSWTSDTQSFILPIDLFHGGIAGGDDCPAAGPSGGCGHLLAGTTRVWETITGNAANSNGTVSWYVTNNPTTANLTKGTLGNRSFINQVKYSPKHQDIAIVGTNDGAVQIGFHLGTGTQAQATWVNVTGSNAVLPNRPVLGIALDPLADNVVGTGLIGYAAVGGFDENTPSTPGHLFRVVCDKDCSSFTWVNKSGNLPNIPIDSVSVNPNFNRQVFAGTDFGLYYTDDITAQSPVWQRFANVPAVMIWDMQVDRGATALSLWTRGRGAYAWPLTTGPEDPLPTALAVAPVSGAANSTQTLSATLTSGGNPVSGKTVTFTLNGNAAGSAVTDASGVATTTATLPTVAGTYPTGVGASFAGDPVYYKPATGSASLTVYSVNLVTTATLAKQGDGSYQATVSVKNNGTGTAQNVTLTGATLGSATGSPLPTVVGDIPAGATGTVTITFPASAGNSGSGTVEKYNGTYNGGSFTTSIRAVLPN